MSIIFQNFTPNCKSEDKFEIIENLRTRISEMEDSEFKRMKDEDMQYEAEQERRNYEFD